MGDRAALRSLLQQCDKVHRKDIQDVTSGHLNENKLYATKSADESTGTGTFWSSAKKEPIWLRKKVILKDHGSHKKQLPPIGRSSKNLDGDIPSSGKGVSAKSKTNSAPDAKRTGNDHNDHSLFYPELMIPVVNENGRLTNQFVPNHCLFPTKREQYEQLKRTGDQLLSDKCGRESVKLSQHDEQVKRITDQMNQRLHLLSYPSDHTLPSYRTLKVYSEAWDKLISSLPDQQQQRLTDIKHDYDAYVAALLDQQMVPGEYDRLETMIGEYGCGVLESEKAALSRLINLEEERLKILEDDLLAELRDNDILRAEIRQSEGSMDKTARSETNRECGSGSKEPALSTNENEPPFRQPQPHDDLEQQVLHLHAQIEEAYEEMSRLKRIQREEYVPRAVCLRLEQCLKETEVDCQKLVKQNDFLEQSIEEMEDELDSIMVERGKKGVNKKRLWQKVSVNRVLNW